MNEESYLVQSTVSGYVRFEAFTVVVVKNAIFLDTKSQFVPHRKNITSPLQSPFG
jgi:hypothetical protein